MRDTTALKAQAYDLEKEKQALSGRYAEIEQQQIAIEAQLEAAQNPVESMNPPQDPATT